MRSEDVGGELFLNKVKIYDREEVNLFNSLLRDLRTRDASPH